MAFYFSVGLQRVGALNSFKYPDDPKYSDKQVWQVCRGGQYSSLFWPLRLHFRLINIWASHKYLSH